MKHLLIPSAAGIVAFLMLVVVLAMICEPFKMTKDLRRAIIMLSFSCGLFIFLINL